jgi:hypothetical protein
MKKNSLCVASCQGRRSTVKKTLVAFFVRSTLPIRFLETDNSTNHISRLHSDQPIRFRQREKSLRKRFETQET